MIPGGGMVVLLLSVQQHSVRFNMSLPLLPSLTRGTGERGC